MTQPTPSTAMKIVFLDRATLSPQTVLRRPGFQHEMTLHQSTAPHQVAEAILHAAQYAQRDIVVGGAMPAPAPRTRLAPRLLEKCMDFIGVRHAHKAAHS